MDIVINTDRLPCPGETISATRMGTQVSASYRKEIIYETLSFLETA